MSFDPTSIIPHSVDVEVDGREPGTQEGLLAGNTRQPCGQVPGGWGRRKGNLQRRLLTYFAGDLGGGVESTILNVAAIWGLFITGGITGELP